MTNRFDLLNTVALARFYLQQEYAAGRDCFSHPGDKACTIAHWTAVLLKGRDWFPGAVALPR